MRHPQSDYLTIPRPASKSGGAFAFGSNRMVNHPSPMTDATAQEKLEALFNEQKLRNAQRKDASTFQSRAQAEADEVRGRFAQIEKADVVGTAATVQYPRLPENSWVNDPVPPEGPLGFSVDAHEAVGEVFELEASLGAATVTPSVADLRDVTTTEASIGCDLDPQSAVASPSSHLAGVERSVAGNPSGDVFEPAPAIPKLKLRGV
jgi:hypothetical protein